MENEVIINSRALDKDAGLFELKSESNLAMFIFKNVTFEENQNRLVRSQRVLIKMQNVKVTDG
jgi:hypothetical protein